MFEFFPDNYNWSLAVVLADSMRGEVSEMAGALEPLRGLAAEADDAALGQWFAQWHRLGVRAEELGDQDQAAGRTRSASRKYLRAATYYLMAERQVSNLEPDKARAYDDALRCFRVGAAGSAHPVEEVRVPYGEHTLPALFVPSKQGGPAPCVVFFNGFDVTKEYLYLMGVTELTERGFSVLLCDQPGSGGALRRDGLIIRHDTEVPAAACVDYLEGRDDVVSERIGLVGISMGGYFATRAAAFEKRLRACVAWGAFHDAPEVADNVRATDGHSVPEFQADWVFGRPGALDDLAALQPFTLDGVVDKVECPLLVLHGASDRQVPLSQAHRTFDGATGTDVKELKVFGPDAWGEQHCQHDSVTLAIDYIGDWLSDVL